MIFYIHTVLSLQDCCSRVIVNCTSTYTIDRLPLPPTLCSRLKSFADANHMYRYMLPPTDLRSKKRRTILNATDPPSTPRKSCIISWWLGWMRNSWAEEWMDRGVDGRRSGWTEDFWWKQKCNYEMDVVMLSATVIAFLLFVKFVPFTGAHKEKRQGCELFLLVQESWNLFPMLTKWKLFALNCFQYVSTYYSGGVNNGQWWNGKQEWKFESLQLLTKIHLNPCRSVDESLCESGFSAFPQTSVPEKKRIIGGKQEG